MPTPGDFAKIEARAAKRKGGVEALEELLPNPKTARALARIGDDRWLAAMAKQIFCAGFVWNVVENKWHGFEVVFDRFDPKTLAVRTDKQLDTAASDTRIIRNRTKVWAVRDNARLVVDLAGEHKSFARFVANWPTDDIVGLLEFLKQRGARLGGFTGQYMLRAMGKDTFMVTGDVTKALIRAKIVDKAPTSKSAKHQVQAAFNHWAKQTGRPLCQLSRILAYSEP